MTMKKLQCIRSSRLLILIAVAVLSLQSEPCLGSFTYGDPGNSGGSAWVWIPAPDGGGWVTEGKSATGLDNSAYASNNRSGVFSWARAEWGILPNSMFWRIRTNNSAGASIDVSVPATWTGAPGPLIFKGDGDNGQGLINIAYPSSGNAVINVRRDFGAFAYGTVSWRVEGEPKPASQDNPLKPGRGTPMPSKTDEETGATIFIPPGIDDSDIEEGATVATDTTGAYLWGLPVSGDEGVDSPVYAGEAVTAPQGVYRPTAYYFGSMAGLGFTSFTVPDGIPGDTSNIVIDNGAELIPYLPGTTHEFETPVMGFALRGLDSSAMPADDQPAPFVYGVTFHKEGSAIVYHAAYPAERVPGDFDGDGDVDGRDFLAWQRGESTRGPLDAQDLADWQVNYNSGSLTTITAVPEPAATLLVMLGTLGLLLRRT